MPSKYQFGLFVYVTEERFDAVAEEILKEKLWEIPIYFNVVTETITKTTIGIDGQPLRSVAVKMTGTLKPGIIPFGYLAGNYIDAFFEYKCAKLF